MKSYETAYQQWMEIFEYADLERRRLLVRIAEAFSRQNMGLETEDDRHLIAMAKRVMYSLDPTKYPEEKERAPKRKTKAR